MRGRGLRLPVYVEIPRVAEILGWTYQKTKRWLTVANALELRAGRWITTPEKLRNSFPEVWEQILDEAEDSDSD